jgi:hypothetical protein
MTETSLRMEDIKLVEKITDWNPYRIRNQRTVEE